MKEIRTPNSIIDTDYKIPFGKFKFTLLAIIILLLGFVINFPLQDIINAQVSNALGKSSPCKLDYQDSKITFFAPGIELKKVNIPNRCLGKGQRSFDLKTLRISFGGFSFSPLGIVLNAQTEIEGDTIDLKIASDSKVHSIVFNDQSFKLEKIIPFLNDKFSQSIPNLSGEVKVNSKIKFEKNKLSFLDLKANSKNFKLPGQAIMGFTLPSIDFKKLKVLVTGEKNKFLIDSLELGNDQSDLILNTDGSFLLNSYNPMGSSLDLNLRINMSEKILTDLAIIKLALANFEKSPGKYALKLKGPVMNPSKTKL